MSATENPPNIPNAPNTPNAPDTQKNDRLRFAIGAALLLALLVWGLYELLFASRYESTDNAYVQGNIVQITPQIDGTITAIYADNTDFVEAGQPLIQLDPNDARVALEEAEAALGATVRQTHALYADTAALAAQLKQNEAEADKARSEAARAKEDLKRRQTVIESGAVSAEDLNHAQTRWATAESSRKAFEATADAAREQLAANRARTEGVAVTEHPSVQEAIAKVRAAWLNHRRTLLPAPVTGQVARRSAQLGERVAAGKPLMSVIPLNQVWVEANFKEVQLRDIRIGQPVRLTADAYGRRVKYTGKVTGLGAGTGAAFALLPAQNATGNWVKVVQRVPVRIALDAEELARAPLRIGLSMTATVDISDKTGKPLSDIPRQTIVAQTSAYETQLNQEAEIEIQRIIAANSVRNAKPETPERAGAGH